MNGFIKGTLIVAALAGIGAGGYFGYKSINNKNKEINNLKTEVSQLQEDNKTKSKEIETLNVKVSEKDKELAKKQKEYEENLKTLLELRDVEIPRIQNELATKTSLLETANGQISTLNTQKVSLLNAVTEIDNKINSTEDAVEIETLEARKSAILTQIDDLNTQIDKLTTDKQALQTEVDNLKVEKANLETEIANLQTRKTQLENEIKTLNTQISDLRTALSQLENTTGFEFIMAQKYIYFENYGNPLYISKSVHSFKDIVTSKAETKIGDNYVLDYVNLDKSQVDDFINFLNKILETNYAFASVSYYKFTFNGDDKCYQESPSSMPGFNDQKFSNATVYYNGQEISDFSVLSSTKSYAIMTQTNEQNLLIYIVDKSPKGKYVSETGNYFDFDNNQSNINDSVSEISDVYFSNDRDSTSSRIVINYCGWSYDVDSDSFEYQGETFTKSEG